MQVNEYSERIPIGTGASSATSSTREVTVLHISDTHGADYASSISHIAADICVHSGDFFSNKKTIAEEISAFKRFFSALPFAHKILVCGNHEKDLDKISNAQLQSMLGEDIILLHDATVEILGIKFYGSPWNDSGHAYGVSASVRIYKWSAIPHDTDVLITHVPPHGILDLAWDPYVPPYVCPVCDAMHHKYSHWGDASLGAAVLERSIPLHLFGHVHDEVGVVRRGATVFSNAAMDIYKIPSVLKMLVSVPAAAEAEVQSHCVETHEHTCWPTDKLLTRLADLGDTAAESKARVVLLSTGAFNPVHIGHVKNMQRTKREMEKQGLVVIAGYLCPSGDLYVSNKMKSKKPSGMSLHKVYAPASIRVQLTGLACADSDWLSCSCFEADKAPFIDFPEVLCELEMFMFDSGYFRHNSGDKVVYVCGEDHYDTCGLSRGIRVSADKEPRHVAVVPRTNTKGGEPLKINSRFMTMIPEEEESSTELTDGSLDAATVSSTMIRTLLHCGDTNMGVLSQMLPPAVYRAMLEEHDPQFCTLYR
jgi:Icc-related predicted phosphoesterase/nicotinic acid mononucleotide adenylyltransferase